MAGTVLLAGGSGMVGEAISNYLISKNYQVRLLTRSGSGRNGIQTFKWDPSAGTIDPQALKNVDYVINLAGENVGKGRWTNERKKQLIASRIDSTSLLVSSINKNKIPVKKFIQASAVGYYGFTNNDVSFNENDRSGTDFLSGLCVDWENEAAKLNAEVPLMIIRIGVVFSGSGGALPTMAKPVKLLAGSPLGKGKQIVPWIHIEDLVNIFMLGINKQEISGVYNAASPNPVSNSALTKAIGKQYKLPVWPVNVPSFVLKIILGEQSQIVLTGNKVSVNKLLNTGYHFKHPDIKEALTDLLG